MPAPNETFVSVDVEASGPYPERYALLSIGACLVDDPSQGFYIELKPGKTQVIESALRVSQLSIERLSAEGVAPPSLCSSSPPGFAASHLPGSIR